MSQCSTNLSANKCSFWGICCESGKKYSQIVERRFHISMAALDPAALSSHFVSLLVERGGSEYLLCSLHKESQLQVNLDLFFDVGEEVSFSLRGQGTVHLSGYYIHDLNDKTNLKNANDNKNIKQNQFTVSSTKNNLSKTIQSSGVKINAQMKGGRKGKGQQKGAEALMNLSQIRLTVQKKDDSDDEGDSDDGDDNEEDSKDEDIEMFKELWRKDELESSIGRTPMPKKPITSSANKKNLYESKKGIQLFKVTAAESDESESEESSDGEEVQVLPNLSKKRPRAADEKEEDSDDDSDDMEIFRELAKKGVQKKLKADISTPSKEKKVNASSTPANATNQKIKAKDEDMDISVGNTLESGKNESIINQSNVSTESSISKKKKKKKKKNAQKEVNSTGANETSNILPQPAKKKDSPIKANGDLSKMQFNKNVGGVAYEDVRIGNGPVAKRGRLVHVNYTGKLENNKVFDSVKPEDRPFSFKLGVGQVVTGWDLAIEGMKVGGKRKFKVPPHLGYKNARIGDIPPNSTLYFEVELKAVS
ncbi:hypothetical protein CEXT_557081 [Caerostris extrusa]|uniref:peptidylprolyl isomerase n=1 Tax=Caerostris extrusa TaxID=172846 RepID=A0AAV4MQP6_CAEEX|nr:hypothetical protein CEXT_557081 [Caerostris extrusa]